MSIREDLIRDEGWRSKPYRDSEGFLTIGVGHNLDAEGLCPQAVEVQLQYDIRTKAIEPCEEHFPWLLSHPEPIKRVLWNMCFNMGIGTVLAFKETLAAIEQKRYNDAANHLLQSKFAKQVPNRAARLAQLLRSAE